ncbi:MAG: multidrug efflux SMR transporter [Gammaproteobacteria bacterium]
MSAPSATTAGTTNDRETLLPWQAWALLTFAVCGEITGAIALRFSAGFSRLGPTVLALAAFAVALFLVSRVMRVLPISVAYPAWAGGGTAGVALLGILALGEPFTPLKALGIALITLGVALVNVVSERRSGC